MRTGGRLTGGTIFEGILAFIAGRVAVALARSIILRPSRNVRFKSAAKKLSTRIEREAILTSRPCSWYLGAPGAFALTAAGELLLADRSTGFSVVRLKPEQIVEAKVERDLTQIVQVPILRTSGSGRGPGRGMTQWAAVNSAFRPIIAAVHAPLADMSAELSAAAIRTASHLPAVGDTPLKI